jgi:hypothetical protein
MKTRSLICTLLLAFTAGGLLPSCVSDGPKRKKVVGPDSSQYSTQPWNRPRKWEAAARSPLGNAAQSGALGGAFQQN